VDVTVERTVVNIRARRAPLHAGPRGTGERPKGEFTRQLFLGDNLDSAKLAADFERGVLHMRIPVSESSRPRRVQIGSQSSGPEHVTASNERRREKAHA
jgi:HSP20 family protein